MKALSMGMAMADRQQARQEAAQGASVLPMAGSGTGLGRGWARQALGALLLLCAWALAMPALQAEERVIQDSGYRLDTGDRIEIRVFGEPDLSVEARIGDDGVIVYPFLGEIGVVGMTVREVENRIVEGLRPDYLINPTVTVSIVEYRNFYIYGAVRSPGGFPFRPGITVRQAVALAGGLTDRASRNRIVVVREGDREGNQLSISLNDTIQPGDTVTVQESFF